VRVKYIVVYEPTEGVYSPIIFPDQLVHRHVARIHSAGLRNVVSAGFAQIDYDQGCGNPPTVTVYGKSESLNLAPLPGDDVIIRDNFT